MLVFIFKIDENLSKNSEAIIIFDAKKRLAEKLTDELDTIFKSNVIVIYLSLQ